MFACVRHASACVHGCICAYKLKELCIDNCKPKRAYRTALMANALIDMSAIKVIIISVMYFIVGVSVCKLGCA